MTVNEIPLTPSTAQKFAIDLGEISYQMRLRWNQYAGVWLLDINQPDGVPIVNGISLITGIDLLSQHKHLGIPVELWVQTDFDKDATPTFDNLGVAGRLYAVVQ